MLCPLNVTQITQDLCLEPGGSGNNSYVRAQGTYRDPGKTLAEKDEVMSKTIRVGVWFEIDEDFINEARETSYDEEITMEEALKSLFNQYNDAPVGHSLMVADNETDEVLWFDPTFEKALPFIEGVDLNEVVEMEEVA